MLSRIFPKQFDNAYRGHWLGLWLFVPIMLLKGVQGANAILITRTVITGADAVPLDSFGADAAQTTIALFALLGVHVLIVPVLSLVALIRYRAMIPLLYVLLLMVLLAGRALSYMQPIVRSEAYPIGFYFNLAILVAAILGFVLSLLAGSKAPASAQPASMKMG